MPEIFSLPGSNSEVARMLRSFPAIDHYANQSRPRRHSVVHVPFVRFHSAFVHSLYHAAVHCCEGLVACRPALAKATLDVRHCIRNCAECSVSCAAESVALWCVQRTDTYVLLQTFTRHINKPTVTDLYAVELTVTLPALGLFAIHLQATVPCVGRHSN